MPIEPQVFDFVEQLVVEHHAMRTMLKHHGLWDEAEFENAKSQVFPHFAPLFDELRRQAVDPRQLGEFLEQVIAGLKKKKQ